MGQKSFKVFARSRLRNAMGDGLNAASVVKSTQAQLFRLGTILDFLKLIQLRNIFGFFSRIQRLVHLTNNNTFVWQ